MDEMYSQDFNGICKCSTIECQLMAGSYLQEQVSDVFLKLLNVSTIQEARQLLSTALVTAYLISNSRS